MADIDRHPRVLISYAHGSPDWDHEREAKWCMTVLQFAMLLCEMGIDADVDQFHDGDASIDWTRFGPRAAQESDFVILAFTSAYRDRWEGRNEPTEGAGAVREADELLGQFESNQEAFQERVKTVILPGASSADIPNQLHRLSRFKVNELNEKAVEDLYRVLTGQPATPKPPVGPLRRLPPRSTGIEHERLEEIGRLETDLARVQAGLANVPEEVRVQALLGNLALPWVRAARQLIDQEQGIFGRLDALGHLHFESADELRVQQVQQGGVGSTNLQAGADINVRQAWPGD
jgi:hypothetical protein